MKKWNVYGTVIIGVSTEVEADTADEVLTIASGMQPSMVNLVNNAVGIDDDSFVLDADYSEIEFVEAEELGDGE